MEGVLLNVFCGLKLYSQKLNNLFETEIRYGKATIIMTITLFNNQLQANLEV